MGNLLVIVFSPTLVYGNHSVDNSEYYIKLKLRPCYMFHNQISFFQVCRIHDDYNCFAPSQVRVHNVLKSQKTRSNDELSLEQEKQQR